MKRHTIFLKPIKIPILATFWEFIWAHSFKGRYMVNLDKEKVIKEFKPPTNTFKIKSFFSHTKYYIKFVKGYAKIAHSMEHLLTKEITYHRMPIRIWRTQEQDHEGTYIKISRFE
jgi:hypothetical protein